MGVLAAAGLVAGASMYSASRANKNAKRAAQQQQEGIERAQEYSREAADEASGMLDPLAAQVTPGIAGMTREQERLQALGIEGTAALKQQQGALDVNQFLNPGMQFAMDQGKKAIEGSLAARGLSQSGAALKELTQFGQGLASQNYNTAVQQAMSNRNQQLGIADSLMAQGASGTNIQNSLLNTGINALGQQANIVSGQGSNNANLAMTSANVGAAAQAAQKDLLGTGMNAALGVMSMGTNTIGGQLFSDENLKKEMDTVTDDEIDEFLSKMQPTSFEYTKEAKAKGAPYGKVHGVMAQDVEKSKVGKRIVSHDEDGHKMLDIPKSVSALMASTASLNKRIKKLEK